MTAAAVFASAYVLFVVVAGSLSALILLFTGILFASALRPLIDRLSKRMPFGAAVTLTFGAVLLVTASIAFIIIAPLGAEVEHLLRALPGYVSALQDQLLAAQRFVKNDELAKQLAGTLANTAGAAFSAIGMHLLGGPALVASTVGNVVIIFLLAIGWILASDDLARFVLSVFPTGSRQDWKHARNDMAVRLSAYAQVIVLNGFIVGVATGSSLAFLGVPYALLLGVVVALLQAIPLVGAIISGPIVLLVVLATSGWTKMLIVTAIFGLVQIVDQNLLSPIIFGTRLQLSFLLIIFSTVTGGLLLGIGGAFLAVPAAAVLQVIVVQIIAPAIRRANQVAPEADSGSGSGSERTPTSNVR
ncbi:MAG: AI-2E family transporter [Candidatus Baltobacteraceae bacterium]